MNTPAPAPASSPPPADRSRPAVVLLVEDNLDYAFLARESFEEARLRVELHHVETGDRALAFLRKQPPYQDAPTPDLVLLDIHMPRMNGYDVMEAMSADPQLKSLVVVVLTTSSDVLDVDRMYRLGARSYLTKPVDFDKLTEVLRGLTHYWFELVVLPQRPPAP